MFAKSTQNFQRFKSADDGAANSVFNAICETLAPTKIVRPSPALSRQTDNRASVTKVNPLLTILVSQLTTVSRVPDSTRGGSR